MTMDYRPLAASYGFPENGSMKFILPGAILTIEGVNDLVLDLLKMCRGDRTIKEILTSFQEGRIYEFEDVCHVLEILIQQNIVVDSNQYYQLFHAVSTNPMPFFYNLSPSEISGMLKAESPLIALSHKQTYLEKLLNNRMSTREFSDQPIPLDVLYRLAWATYGRTERNSLDIGSTIGFGTVPSGGALYPLKLYGIVLQSDPSIQQGIYKIGQKGFDRIDSVSYERISRIFFNEDDILTCAFILVIACNFIQTTQKYSNRGYRYGLLEAGHAAQNAYLWCIENDFSIVEVGGFLDEDLAKELSIQFPQEAPVTTLMIGKSK